VAEATGSTQAEDEDGAELGGGPPTRENEITPFLVGAA